MIPYATPTYTQQNLKFDLLQLLQSNEVFIKLKDLYQNYKIRFVTFKAIPRIVNGTQPKPCYIYLDTQNLINFNYVAIPTLQRGKICNGKGNQTFRLKSLGRQDDFNYWFDTMDGPNASIRLRSESEPTNQVFWQFQIGYALLFRGMVLNIQQDEKVIEQVIGEKKQVIGRQEVPLEKCRDMKHFESQLNILRNKLKELTVQIGDFEQLNKDYVIEKTYETHATVVQPNVPEKKEKRDPNLQQAQQKSQTNQTKGKKKKNIFSMGLYDDKKDDKKEDKKIEIKKNLNDEELKKEIKTKNLKPGTYEYDEKTGQMLKIQDDDYENDEDFENFKSQISKPKNYYEDGDSEEYEDYNIVEDFYAEGLISKEIYEKAKKMSYNDAKKFINKELQKGTFY